MGKTLGASAHQSEPRLWTPVHHSGVSLPGPPSLPPSQPLWMGIKKEKKEMVLPPPGRRAHDEKCFLLIVVSVEPPLPPSLTCRDLLAARLVFPTPGLAGEGVAKTTLPVGWRTRRVGVGVRGRTGKGEP